MMYVEPLPCSAALTAVVVPFENRGAMSPKIPLRIRLADGTDPAECQARFEGPPTEAKKGSLKTTIPLNPGPGNRGWNRLMGSGGHAGKSSVTKRIGTDNEDYR